MADEDRQVSLLDGRLVVDPTAFFRQITKGTTFEDNERMQEHLATFGNSFQELLGTDQGRTMLQSLEGIVTEIKDQVGFRSAVKVIWRFIQELGANPMVQLSLFVGLVGLLVALVGFLAGPALAAAEAWITNIIATQGLAPLVYGVTGTLAAFFNSQGDQLMKKLALELG